jgi:tetratricopeptide (TPR) repeat protein
MEEVNVGEIFNLLRRHEEAQASYGRALEVFRKTAAVASFRAYALTGVAVARLGLGHPDEAEPLLEEALRIRTADRAGPSLMGEVRFALARALWARPAARPRALTLARAALADYAQVKVALPPPPDIAAWLRAPSSRI